MTVVVTRSYVRVLILGETIPAFVLPHGGTLLVHGTRTLSIWAPRGRKMFLCFRILRTLTTRQFDCGLAKRDTKLQKSNTNITAHLTGVLSQAGLVELASQ